jgi:hypothetical protein
MNEHSNANGSSNEILLALDVEAVLLDDVEETGSIDYYFEQVTFHPTEGASS